MQWQRAVNSASPTPVSEFPHLIPHETHQSSCTQQRHTCSFRKEASCQIVKGINLVCVGISGCNIVLKVDEQKVYQGAHPSVYIYPNTSSPILAPPHLRRSAAPSWPSQAFGSSASTAFSSTKQPPPLTKYTEPHLQRITNPPELLRPALPLPGIRRRA